MAPVTSSSSERITLKDMTCPVIRLDKSRRRDKSVSFSISLFLHALIFVMVGVSLIKTPEFGVDKGIGGIEVSLVAAPNEPQTVPEEIKEELPPPEPESIPEPIPEPPKPKTEEPPLPEKPKVETNGKDKVNMRSVGGAITEAKPDYFQNPAPEYPYQARQRGWDGTVLLKVQVGKGGEALTVELEKTSGHKLLDETAIKAVKKWKFKPALLGDMPIESSVRVPVKFDLKRT